MGAWEAVDRLTITRQFGRDHVGVEADIKGFVDTIEHGWLGRMWEERMDDGAFLRLSQKWLKAGGRDNRPPGSVRGRSGHWPSYRDDGCMS